MELDDSDDSDIAGEEGCVVVVVVVVVMGKVLGSLRAVGSAIARPLTTSSSLSFLTTRIVLGWALATIRTDRRVGQDSTRGRSRIDDGEALSSPCETLVGTVRLGIRPGIPGEKNLGKTCIFFLKNF